MSKLLKDGSGAARSRQRGLSLIELMVAMAIGAVLIFGATDVYIKSRNSYGVNENVSRLQETARYAMSIIEPDVRMSNFWGLLKGAGAVTNQAAQTAAPGAVAAGAAINICGNNFAIDLGTNLQGDNNGGAANGIWLSATRQPGCNSLTDLDTGATWTTTPVATADTLIVRRASVFPNSVPPWPKANVLEICTTRISGRLQSDTAACSAAPAGQLSNLIVDAYYVDRNSLQQAGLPALRRKFLDAGGTLRFLDQEVIPGVEDMQVQFGIDPFGNTGVATRYVDPDAVPAAAQIVAVRVWLLVRSDTAEVGFTDNATYQYGDRLQATGVTGDLNNVADAGKAYQPSLNPDATVLGPRHVRRLLISRTISLRNALGT
jgi:type IV pilus assembly protein PilW